MLVALCAARDPTDLTVSRVPNIRLFALHVVTLLAPSGVGFTIEDKYNTDELDPEYFNPVKINTMYGGGLGAGVTGSGEGGWSEFDGSGDWGNG